MVFPAGKDTLTFDTGKFDFRSLLLNLYRTESVPGQHVELESLELMHTLPGIKEDVEHYRQMAFSFFRTDTFQATFRAFGADLIDRYYGGEGMIQRTPTVRIQLPGSMLTSYHTDGWYGHGGEARSFWLPLTKVRKGNTLYMARSVEESRNGTQEILSRRASLDEINSIARVLCDPFEGDFGEFLTFSSGMLHGCEHNSTEDTRFSFDFRIVPGGESLGTKPMSNFYSRQELGNTNIDSEVATTSSEKPDLKTGITYSATCRGKSAKSQLLLASAYADANSIGIVGNESEILALDYMPVMRSYLEGADSRIDCVVTFGIDIFEGNADLMESIFDVADQTGRSIVFAAEGCHYSPEADRSFFREML